MGRRQTWPIGTDPRSLLRGARLPDLLSFPFFCSNQEGVKDTRVNLTWVFSPVKPLYLISHWMKRSCEAIRAPVATPKDLGCILHLFGG